MSGGQNKFVWNAELDAELTRVRREGMSYRECGDHFGMAESIVARRCRELGLNQKMNRGRIAAREALKIRNMKRVTISMPEPINDH